MEEQAPDSKLEPWGKVFAFAGLGIVLSLVALVVAAIVFLMWVGSAFGPD